jgi:hypothetical protein
MLRAMRGLAAWRRRGDKGAFGCGHGDGERDRVDGEGTGDSEWERDVADDILATGVEDAGVVVMGQGDGGVFESFGARSAGCGRLLDKVPMED